MYFLVRDYPKGELLMSKNLNKTETNKGSEIDSKPFEYALSVIGGKWKLNILFWLWRKDIMRYNELKKSIYGITHKMLSNQLKELECNGIIIRHEYPNLPPKVEYYLSKRGKSLMPILHELCKWGKHNSNN